jgi:hypothetical protein
MPLEGDAMYTGKTPVRLSKLPPLSKQGQRDHLTLAKLRLRSWFWPLWLSLLERTNRQLRRKFRQACCFGSLKGAEVAIYLQVERFNARWAKQPWWEASQSLSFDFLTLNP